MHAKPGDFISAGDPLFTLFTDESPRFERALQVLDDAVTITAGGVAEQLPLVIERIV
jgi:thymidine phosphorylase